MTIQAPDDQLVTAYAADGSEEAFGALVKRHAGMVFATALRQVGEAGLAEEVTQNTFLALARKAPSLRGHQTLAGWLHRTALLEAKARIRQELRRRRREEAAATLSVPAQDGPGASDQLVPLLDEALMHLRDPDRQALVLRFLEGCSLRAVGEALGVEEEAARKRVTRALDRVSDFFRQRGFAVPAATLAAWMSEQAASAVPAGLCAATTQAVAAAPLATSTLHLAGVNIMALTKTQTALVTLALVAVPLAWQWRAQATVERELSDTTLMRTQAVATLQSLEAHIAEQRAAMRGIQTEQANAEARLARHQARIEKREPPPVYEWNDFAPLARVPKALLAHLSISSVSGRRGTLNERMIAVLQLTDLETRQTQGAIDAFLNRYHADQATRMRPVEPNERELKDHAHQEVRVFEMTHSEEALAALRADLFASLQDTLGPERAEQFKRGLGDWMPLDDAYQGLNSGMAVVNADHRVVFYQPEPESNSIMWGVNVEGRGSMHISGEPGKLSDWLPEHLRSQIQDWIDLAQPSTEVPIP